MSNKLQEHSLGSRMCGLRPGNPLSPGLLIWGLPEIKEKSGPQVWPRSHLLLQGGWTHFTRWGGCLRKDIKSKALQWHQWVLPALWMPNTLGPAQVQGYMGHTFSSYDPVICLQQWSKENTPWPYGTRPTLLDDQIAWPCLNIKNY